MKNQALFSSKDKSKKLKCRLLQYLFGALKVGSCPDDDNPVQIFICPFPCSISESVAAEKAQDFAGILRFSFVYYSPTLKKWGYTGFGLSVIP